MALTFNNSIQQAGPSYSEEVNYNQSFLEKMRQQKLAQLANSGQLAAIGTEENGKIIGKGITDTINAYYDQKAADKKSDQEQEKADTDKSRMESESLRNESLNDLTGKQSEELGLKNTRYNSDQDLQNKLTQSQIDKNEMEAKKSGQPAGLSTKDSLEMSNNLRKDYDTKSEDTDKAMSSYNKIKSLAEKDKPSGADDLSLISAYIKFNNPTARINPDSEMQVEDDGPMNAKFVTRYNNLRENKGNQLTPEERQDIVDAASSMLDPQLEHQAATDKYYQTVAPKYQVDPTMVINPDYGKLSQQRQAEKANKQIKAKQIGFNQNPQAPGSGGTAYAGPMAPMPSPGPAPGQQQQQVTPGSTLRIGGKLYNVGNRGELIPQ